MCINNMNIYYLLNIDIVLGMVALRTSSKEEYIKGNTINILENYGLGVTTP